MGEEELSKQVANVKLAAEKLNAAINLLPGGVDCHLDIDHPRFVEERSRPRLTATIVKEL